MDYVKIAEFAKGLDIAAWESAKPSHLPKSAGLYALWLDSAQHRPDWAISFTVAPSRFEQVLITYSDRLGYGVSLDEAMSYCDRHQVAV